jgi:hypothetical protein
MKEHYNEETLQIMPPEKYKDCNITVVMTRKFWGSSA